MARTKLGRGRRTEPDVRAKIEALHDQGLGPSSIERIVQAKFKNRAPGLRTIQDIVRGLRQRLDDRGPVWTLVNADPDDAALVLPVQAEVVVRTQGRTADITPPEADVIARLLRMAPDLPTWSAYRLARRWLASEPGSDALKAIEYYLGFGPWRGPEAVGRYGHAFGNGWISHIVPVGDADEVAAILDAAGRTEERAHLRFWTPDRLAELDSAMEPPGESLNAEPSKEEQP